MFEIKITQNSLIIIFIIIATVLSACANQMSPTGGEIDRIPPEIIYTYPEDGKLNFNDNYLEFEFSEYVRKESVNEAIFISPQIEKGFELNWSGRSLKINFNEKLKENTTYVVSIGTTVADFTEGNKMKQSKEIFFSTGAKLDVGVISGKIFEKDLTNVVIFAYMNPSDTLNPSITKPDFVSQPNLDGVYIIPGLPFANYKVFAIKDRMKDLLYDVIDDEYGCSYKDVLISEKDSVVSDVNFLITKRDTTPPNIPNISMPDRNKILIDFNEKIDSSKTYSNNFVIIDSTLSKQFLIQLLSLNNQSKNQYLLSFKDSLNISNPNYLIARDIYDLEGNKNNEIINSLFLSSKVDTVKPYVKSLFGNVDAKTISIENPEITITFSENVLINKNELILRKMNEDELKKEVFIKDDANITLKVTEKLKAKDDITLKVNLKAFPDLAGNYYDSLYTAKIRVEDGLNYSGVSGVYLSEAISNVIVNIYHIDSKKYYSQKIKENKFDFTKVQPGKYLLWYYQDTDNNHKYTYGKVYPHQFAEKFIYYSDTLNLRARWPIGDIKLKEIN